MSTKTQGKLVRRLAAILAVTALVAVGIAVLPGATATSEDSEIRLFHTIQRGDLSVSVTERGTLQSAENTEIKCKVRGQNTIIWVIPSGTIVDAGDELLRLDTLTIEDFIAERSKYANWSQSGADSWNATANRSKLAIDEYKDGRFKSQLMTMEKNLAIAEQSLVTAENMLTHAQAMSERGYVSNLEVEEKTFAVQQSKLAKEVIETDIRVLKEFTQKEELERLQGNWRAAVAEYKAAAERAKMDGIRRDLAVDELALCVVKADKPGMVIHPTTEAWKSTPDIEEGASVHKEQTLLLMPDLGRMQAKVGVHESVIDRLKPGLSAVVRLPDLTLTGTVKKVATVAQPTGWWSGNTVKYDTIIDLPAGHDLKPGMSAGVEVILAQHSDVLTIPVAAVVQASGLSYAWLRGPSGILRREVTIGDSNDIFMIIQSGLNVGDEVVLNPTAYLDDAKELVEAEDDDLK